MINKDVQKLIKNLMLDLDDSEIKKLENESFIILEQMKLVQKIDTTGIEPMDYPFFSATNKLRIDKVTKPLTQEQVLANSPSSAEGFITINQVVK